MICPGTDLGRRRCGGPWHAQRHRAWSVWKLPNWHLRRHLHGLHAPLSGDHDQLVPQHAHLCRQLVDQPCKASEMAQEDEEGCDPCSLILSACWMQCKDASQRQTLPGRLRLGLSSRASSCQATGRLHARLRLHTGSGLHASLSECCWPMGALRAVQLTAGLWSSLEMVICQACNPNGLPVRCVFCI